MSLPLQVEATGPHAAPFERRLLERAVAGRYKVIRLIARGAMGAVYEAWEHGLERRVAIKFLDVARAADADERGRFRREGRVLAMLQHPGIVPVYATGEAEGTAYFVMPCVAGTLAQRLGADRRLPYDEARSIMSQLARALAHVHGHGIVHRDLKAENILVDAGSGRPMLSDFGVALVRTSDHSMAEVWKGYGTPRYAAPEQLLGDLACDHRADIHALGVLGFRMVTGRFPFEGGDAEIVAQRVAREAPGVAQYAAGVPADLAAAIDRCLARRARDRHAGAAMLGAAIDPALSLPAGVIARLRHRLLA